MTNTAGSTIGAYSEEELSYTYDSNGNILTITVVTKTEGQQDVTKVIEYEYNELNEVIRENNQVLNKTMTYSYDLGGNLLSKSEYAYTTESLGNPVDTIDYVYGDTNWKDKLTSYDGNTMTYDEIGNLETFDGNTYTWEEGRRLKSITNTNQSISYMYNASGIRTSKTVDGVTTDYHLVGDKVTLETDGTNTIYYTYDASGKLISMNLTNTTYPSGAEFYYIRNAQGDISGLYDSTGTEVVSYTYDTWGKLEGIDGTLANTVGVINPYRYRCYRYDSEAGMYYLQSRYYNPEIGRFINADVLLSGIGESVLGCNTFSYCINNPVNMHDPTGFRQAMYATSTAWPNSLNVDTKQSGTNQTTDVNYYDSVMVCDSYFFKTKLTVSGTTNDKTGIDEETLAKYVEDNRVVKNPSVEYTTNTSFGTTYDGNPTLSFISTGKADGVIMIYEITYEFKHREEGLIALVIATAIITVPIAAPTIAWGYML